MLYLVMTSLFIHITQDEPAAAAVAGPGRRPLRPGDRGPGQPLRVRAEGVAQPGRQQAPGHPRAGRILGSTRHHWTVLDIMVTENRL